MSVRPSVCLSVRMYIRLSFYLSVKTFAQPELYTTLVVLVFAIADPMLGSCYNMNFNILDRNKEFLIADPIMGSCYNMNIYISDVTH